jgi:hypothetical protein
MLGSLVLVAPNHELRGDSVGRECLNHVHTLKIISSESVQRPPNATCKEHTSPRRAAVYAQNKSAGAPPPATAHQPIDSVSAGSGDDDVYDRAVEVLRAERAAFDPTEVFRRSSSSTTGGPTSSMIIPGPSVGRHSPTAARRVQDGPGATPQVRGGLQNSGTPGHARSMQCRGQSAPAAKAQVR